MRDLLKDYKKSNKERRNRIITKAGFTTEKDYLLSLGMPLSQPAIAEDSRKPVIHNVHILDVSGSMDENNKLHNAIAGINEEINMLKKDDLAEYKLTIITFSGWNEYFAKCNKTPIRQYGTLSGVHSIGMTALYDAIGKTLTSLMALPTPGEKVLVKIFTDGAENNSMLYSAGSVKKLIAGAEAAGFTITFVGTHADVLFVQNALSIHASNTLSHDNTSAGVMHAFAETATATTEYSKKVLKKEDVSRGFYKRVENKTK